MELLGLGPLAWLVAAVVVIIGSILQGSMGFGLGLIAAPVLVLLDPGLVPGVVIGMVVPLALLIAWRERHARDTKLIRWAIVGRLPGAVAGTLAVVALNTRALAIVFACSILVAVALSISGISIRRTTSTMVAAGFISGLMGTATSVGGPPIALVFQHDSGPELRAAVGAFMAFGAIVSLGLLTAVGEFGLRELRFVFVLVPFTIVGFLVSARTNRFLDNGYTRPSVLAVAAAAAVAVLIRSI